MQTAHAEPIRHRLSHHLISYPHPTLLITWLLSAKVAIVCAVQRSIVEPPAATCCTAVLGCSGQSGSWYAPL